MELPRQKTIFSGLQPSGAVHIGNYLGAIQQWVSLQANNTAYYCIVDQHAITVRYEPIYLPERVLNTAALYLAAGLDPKKSCLFVQSHVPAHTELAWLLSTITAFGELSRMTQFKEKADKHPITSLGLFSYPVLMAADILLYQTDLVPVGQDQVQHLELTRTIARRFNTRFDPTFTEPEAWVNKHTARIMSLTEPTKKMSKNDQPDSYIALLDSPEVIAGKIKGAVTETEPVFSFSKSGPAVQNLLRIYQAFSQLTPPAIEEKFTGHGYKVFKETLTELLVEKLKPLRKRYHQLRQDDQALRAILEKGRQRANNIASKTLTLAKQKMGLR